MWSTRQTVVRQEFEQTTEEVAIAPFPDAVPQMAMRKDLVARKVPVLKPINYETVPAGFQEVEARIANLPPNRFAISMRWNYAGKSNDRDADLDLWIADKRYSEELNFHNMRTDFGFLSRDIQQVMQDEQDFTLWEYVEIESDQIADLAVYVNVYRATGPVKCLLRMAWHGKILDHEFTFDVTHGDSSEGRSNRDSSPAWRQIPLTKLFGVTDN